MSYGYKNYFLSNTKLFAYFFPLHSIKKELQSSETKAKSALGKTKKKLEGGEKEWDKKGQRGKGEELCPEIRGGIIIYAINHESILLNITFWDNTEKQHKIHKTHSWQNLI